MAVIRPIEATQGLNPGGIPDTRVNDGLGQGLQAIGDEVSRYAEIKRKADDFATSQAFDRWQQDNSAHFSDQQANIDPSGVDFAKNTATSFAQRRDEFLKTVPGWLKGKYGELTSTAVNGWSDKAVAAELDQRDSWYKQGISDRADQLEVQVFNDPNQFEAAKSDAYRKIDASGLTAKDKEEARRKVDERLQLAVGKSDIAKAEADPSSAADAAQRLGVPGADPVGTVVSKIVGAESGGDANAKNPNSSASGVGQFINSTWLSTVKKYRPDIAAGKSDREILALKSNPALGREMTTRLTQQNASDLSAAGLPVTPGTLYLAHFAGIGGARAVLRAGDGASVSDVLGPEVTKANGFLAGKTVGWLKGWADKKMGGATPSVPTDPRYEGLTLDQRLSIYEKVEAARQRGQTAIDAQSRYSVETAVNNAPYAVQNTGSYSGRMPTPEDFQRAYGADGAGRYASFMQSMDVAQTSFQMQGMSADKIAEVVNGAKPTSSGNDAAFQSKRYETLSTAAERTIKAREADPSTYVTQNFPHVAQAWQDAVPGNYQDAIAASFAAQKQLGIRNIQPLPTKMATDAVAQFKKEDSPEKTRIDAIASLVLSTNDPEQRRAIFSQLVKAGLPDYTEGAMVALSRGDEGAARRLFQAAMIDPSKLPGKSPETPDSIKSTIQSDVMDEGQIGDVYYGLSDGSTNNFVTAQRDAKLLNNAVELRLRNGESLSDAVSGAAKDLYGDVKAVSGDSRVNAHILVPTDQDEGRVLDGLNAALPQVRSALEAAMPAPSDANPSNGGRAVVNAARDNRINDIMSNGYFRNMGDGYAFFDAYSGTAVTGSDGKPLIFNADDLPEPAPVRAPSRPAWPGERAGEYVGSLVPPAPDRSATPPKPAPLPPTEQTPQSQIQQDRQQLFDNAEQSGLTTPSAQDILSGNDPVFGAR
jgi:hypothetical protein